MIPAVVIVSCPACFTHPTGDRAHEPVTGVAEWILMGLLGGAVVALIVLIGLAIDYLIRSGR
jgi:hypothetical protein